MDKNYIDDIKAEMASARINRTQDATCTYLILKYYEELTSYPIEGIPKLFDRKPSWIIELRKGRALGAFMRERGEL